MNQASLGLNLSTKKTRKREFLEEMERVVPCLGARGPQGLAQLFRIQRVEVFGEHGSWP